MATTLNEILKEHPEWGNLPVVVYDEHSEYYHYIGESGNVYEANDYENPDLDINDVNNKSYPVLVFSGN